MKSWKKAQKAWVAVATSLLVTAGASQAWALAQNTKVEGKCHKTLAKVIRKHVSDVTSALVECENAALNGGPACPDATATTEITESAAKVQAAADKTCHSTCNVSEVPCIDSSVCPPNGAFPEGCTTGPGEDFNARSMFFPGPYCNAYSGGGVMRDPDDFGLCAIGTGNFIVDEILDNLFGDLVAAPAAEGQECLDALTKALPKTAVKLAGLVSKCRIKQITDDSASILPSDCATADAKVAGQIEKAHLKLASTIEKSCSVDGLTQLSLCKNGIGGTTTVLQAQTCLTEVLDEVSIDGDANRPYATLSIVNAAFPQTAGARCGDGIINQLPNQFALSGEECDGAELGSCAACLPPGDIFECTCAETRRSRVFADGFAADLDNGWTGASHNSKTPDGAGFVAEVSGCDCTEFTGATCTGTSGDSVCDVFAETQPRCSHRIGDGSSCDAVGNNNGVHTDSDCRACGTEATNGGDFCTGTARFCLGGSSDGSRCNEPSDCPGGGTCTATGRCETGSFAGKGCIGPQNCGVCTAGTNLGQPCSNSGTCGVGGVCAINNSCTAKSCLGGGNNELPCDVDADCPSGRCADTGDCLARCYDANDVDMGPCWAQSDCGAGEQCRGGCNSVNYCLKIRNGAPLPLSSEGTSVCVDSQFFTNVTGTRDIFTGTHAVNYELRSLVHLGGDNMINSVPCPVCGGYCAVNSPGTSHDRARCEGSCSGPELECRFGENKGNTCTTNADCDGFLCGAVACRFDTDCPIGGTCSGTASPECQGKDCRLDLSCSVGPNDGLPCRIEAYTAFGTTSADCPPYPGQNYTGTGLAISWTPLTSGTVSLESPAPCNATGFQNFDCNCVFAGGLKNAPNKCAPACTGPTNPADTGKICDAFTTCVGGSEVGAACDEDSDCSGGGTCSGNPRVCGTGNNGVCSVSHCVGGDNDGGVCASNAQCEGVVNGVCTIDTCVIGMTPCTDGECIADACTTNADCELGVTCDDACAGGRCTPLCVERGTCNGGLRDGDYCALDKDCVGGGTCDGPDPEEGACAQGTFNHCDGKGWEFVSCSPPQVGTQKGCEWGTDNFPNGPNANIGAGYCRSDINHCFINDGTATGGGDPTDSYSVATFCIPASTNTSINSTAGLPGPGRIRQPARVVINFDSLP